MSRSLFLLISLCVLSAAGVAQAVAAATPSPTPTPAPDNGNSLFTRAVVGLDMSGGSSLATQQHFFVEANVSAPVNLWKNEDAGSRSARESCLHTISDLSQQLRTSPPSDKMAEVMTAGAA